jgi:class 3 adenylate cyclase
MELQTRFCTSADVVRQLATGKGLLFSDLGDVVPKGFEDPVRLYEVRWRAEGSPSDGLPSEGSP